MKRTPSMRRTRRRLARLIDPTAEDLCGWAITIMCNVEPEPGEQREEWATALRKWENAWLGRVAR
jgi:hypothetical protein